VPGRGSSEAEFVPNQRGMLLTAWIEKTVEVQKKLLVFQMPEEL
jgi:hypothetical protein